MGRLAPRTKLAGGVPSAPSDLARWALNPAISTFADSRFSTARRYSAPEKFLLKWSLVRLGELIA